MTHTSTTWLASLTHRTAAAVGALRELAWSMPLPVDR